MKEAIDFMLKWYAYCDGYCEITLLDDLYKDDDEKRRHPMTAWLPVADLREKLPAALGRALERNKDGYGVYFGVTSRREKQEPGKRGGKANALHLPGLWIDLDCGQDKIEQAARDLAAWMIPPTTVVATGGGVQAWWMFTDAIPLDDEERRAYWERVLRGMARALRADTAVADVARIMRCPDTANMKPGRGEYVARVISDGSGLRHNPFEFIAFENLATPPQREWKPTPNSNGKRRRVTNRAQDFIEGGAVEGARHTGLIHAAYQMQTHGYSKEETYALAGNAALKSGLSDREVVNVIEYVYGK